MIIKNIAIALTTGALMLGSLAPAAFADDMHHQSSGNYNKSHHSSNYNWNSNYSSHYWNTNSVTKLSSNLNGSQEVPGPGDPNGTGYAKVKIKADKSQICINMRVNNIQPAQAAHIHEAPAGASGPVVVTLPTPNAWGYVNGCVYADQSLVNEMVQNPSDYYINVHNAEYPNGAVRGQL